MTRPVITSGYTTFTKAVHGANTSRRLAIELADWYREHKCKVLITDCSKEWLVCWKGV